MSNYIFYFMHGKINILFIFKLKLTISTKITRLYQNNTICLSLS